MQFILKGIILFVAVLIGLSTIGKMFPSNKKVAQQATNIKNDPSCVQWRESVNFHLESGLFFKHTEDWKEVQIDPMMWNRITADNKKTIIDNTAKCLSDGKITFKDKMSGKVLGDRGYLSTATLY